MLWLTGDFIYIYKYGQSNGKNIYTYIYTHTYKKFYLDIELTR